jgi:hypothetical protein
MRHGVSLRTIMDAMRRSHRAPNVIQLACIWLGVHVDHSMQNVWLFAIASAFVSIVSSASATPTDLSARR